jgi:sulfatase maturation enzyme AslB (radical SAM superfamily)
MKPIYCGLAFGAISISKMNEIKPCCGIIPANFLPISLPPTDSLEEKINNPQIRELRKSLINGEWHPACYGCRDNEIAGVDSMRTIWSRSISDAPIVEYIDPKNVKYLDITLGNKCNSKCMTCGPKSSSLWEKEWEARLYPKIPIISRNDVEINDKFSKNLLDTFSNIENLSFIGGEPLIIDEHLNLLRMCVDNGMSENIGLSYVTNLSKYDREIFNLWKKFRSISLSFSIDGTNLVNDYLRYPVKFSKIVDNLKQYFELYKNGNFYTTLSCTISLFNINEFPDLLDFYISFILERRKHLDVPFDFTTIFLNRVTFSEYFNSSVLSVEFRKKSIEKLKKVKERIKLLDLHPSFLQSCDLIESWANEPQFDNKNLVEEAIKFITETDRFRNHNIDDFIPGILDELKSYVSCKK